MSTLSGSSLTGSLLGCGRSCRVVISVGAEAGLHGSLPWFEFEQLCFWFDFLTKPFQGRDSIRPGCSIELLDLSWLSLLLIGCASPPPTLTSRSLFQWRHE